MQHVYRYVEDRLAEGVLMALSYNRDYPKYELLVREVLKLFLQVAVVSYSDARKERLGLSAIYRLIGRTTVRQKDSLQIYDRNSSVDFNDSMLMEQAVLTQAELLKRAVKLLGMSSLVRVTWISLIQDYVETIPGSWRQAAD